MMKLDEPNLLERRTRCFSFVRDQDTNIRACLLLFDQHPLQAVLENISSERLIELLR